MKTIWKFALSVGRTEISVPRSSELLSVQEQHKKATIWVLVPDEAQMETRTFLGVMTGQTIDTDKTLTFIDTVQLDDGHCVLHIFEEKS